MGDMLQVSQAPLSLPILPDTPPKPKLWIPRRVLVTPGALTWPHGRRIAELAGSLGIDVVELKNSRIGPILRRGTPQETYAFAKTTLAVVEAPPSKRRLSPIPPSADWQFHIAEGCPAHCQYCYLAGSLTGAPVTRVYANLEQILEGLPGYQGVGHVTSRNPARVSEGTTFEVSCYTDPLAIEHLSGSTSEAIRFFARWEAPVQLRLTTKFDDVEPLLGIEHAGRTRVRFSVNGVDVTRNWEGGTATLAARLSAMHRLATAGYPVGLTIAPIMPVPGWQDQYEALLLRVRDALTGVHGLDLTVEMITHRFTASSKQVLEAWYPRSSLDMDETRRARKRTKFGTEKFVYPVVEMRSLRTWFERALSNFLPQARVLYWT